MSFKNNLKNECAYQDIQYKELAGKINIPYTTLLSYVNNKECLPNVEIAYRISKVLNVSMEYLVTGTNYDKNKFRYETVYKELITLPTPVITLIKGLIHNFYELYNLKGEGNEN